MGQEGLVAGSMAWVGRGRGGRWEVKGWWWWRGRGIIIIVSSKWKRVGGGAGGTSFVSLLGHVYLA